MRPRPRSLAGNFECRVWCGHGAREGKLESKLDLEQGLGQGCNQRAHLKVAPSCASASGMALQLSGLSQCSAGAQCPVSAGLRTSLSFAAQPCSAGSRPVRRASGREIPGRPSSAAESECRRQQRRPRGSGGRCCGLRGSAELGGCLHVLPRTI